MKAVRYHEKGAPDVMRVEEVENPRPGAGEVLVRIEAAGINYGDVLRRSGHYYPIPTPLPHIPGGEIVGTIEAVGEGVDSGRVGKRIFALGMDGGYAEYAVRSEHMTYPFPDNFDPVTGVALMIQGLTAALTLKVAGQLRPGDSVFVPAAAGGVGSLAVQLARHYGAGMVIGGASSEAKRDLISQLGADAAIDYTQDDWSKLVLELTGGKGVNLALEMSGGKIFEETFASLAVLGRMVIYGNASDIRFTISPEILLKRALTTTGFFLGPFLPQRQLIEGLLDELCTLTSEGKLKVHVGGRYGLDEAAAAHRSIEDRSSVGKLVVVP